MPLSFLAGRCRRARNEEHRPASTNAAGASTKFSQLLLDATLIKPEIAKMRVRRPDAPATASLHPAVRPPAHDQDREGVEES